MKKSERWVLWFAPITVVFEWTMFVWVVSRYPMNFDQPFSSLPYLYPELYLVFGVFLTLVGIFFAIFSVALRQFWDKAVLYCCLLIIPMILGGWALYDPNGGFWNAVHANSITLAVVGYCFLILQVSLKAKGLYRQASRIFSTIAVMSLIATTLSLYIFHSAIAWFQILILLTVQAWALYTAFYLWKRKPVAATTQ